MDIPDIELVVVNSPPATLSQLYQVNKFVECPRSEKNTIQVCTCTHVTVVVYIPNAAHPNTTHTVLYTKTFLCCRYLILVEMGVVSHM